MGMGHRVGFGCTKEILLYAPLPHVSKPKSLAKSPRVLCSGVAVGQLKVLRPQVGEGEELARIGHAFNGLSLFGCVSYKSLS